MIDIKTKKRLKYKLCKIIVEEHSEIMKELKIILNEQNGYKLNKINKHHPFNINKNIYDIIFICEKKDNTNNSYSFSLLKKNKYGYLNYYLNTAKMRNNLTQILGTREAVNEYIELKHKYKIECINIFSIKDNLQKLKGNNIDIKFPSLKNMYDVVYVIKTSNYHLHTNKHYECCNLILICIDKNKKINIMFDNDNTDNMLKNINKKKYKQHRKNNIINMFK